MKTKIFSVVVCVTMLAGCRQADEIDNMSEELPVSIEASIGNMQMSRYASSDDSPNNLSFIVNDEIGLFVHDRSVVKWTLEDDGWKPTTSSHWPNKDDDFWFYAYYPYDEATSKGSVKMPSLAGQKGSIESLSACDFLVASTEETYVSEEDDGIDGQVSFTGSASFEHVSSLVAITIKGDCDLKTSTIQQISFSAPDIASGTTYSFSDKTTTVVGDKKSNKMESEALNFEMENVDKTFYFILNNGIAFSDITFSIKYSTNGIKYNAEKVGLGEEGKLERGKRYNFSLNISDGILTVSGGEIQNWGDGTQMDDIEINNPIVDNNQADENA